MKAHRSSTDMAKVQIKSEQITPFGGIFSIMEQFDALLSLLNQFKRIVETDNKASILIRQNNMRTLDYLHLNESAVANVVIGLNQHLADYQIFYQSLRGFHWNIKGNGFFVLHDEFEDIYDDVANKIVIMD